MPKVQNQPTHQSYWQGKHSSLSPVTNAMALPPHGETDVEAEEEGEEAENAHRGDARLSAQAEPVGSFRWF